MQERLKRLISTVREMMHKLFYRRIEKTVHFTGRKYITISKTALISQNTWLNVNSRDTSPKISIGNYCYIGRNNFFTSGKKISIDDYSITSVNCNFLGSEHDYSNPMIPYYFAPTSNEKEIIIETNVFVGANVSIIGNVCIGYGSVIGANSVIVNADIPPFSLVVGNPGHVIKRFSFPSNEWKSIESWSKADESAIIDSGTYKSKLNIGKKTRLPYKSIGKSNGDMWE